MNLSEIIKTKFLPPNCMDKVFFDKMSFDIEKIENKFKALIKCCKNNRKYYIKEDKNFASSHFKHHSFQNIEAARKAVWRFFNINKSYYKTGKI